MKKFAVLLIGTFLLMSSAFAGGILTNTNQSAQFARMLSRNASLDLDAVYFNPAGLTQMKNGFYFGVHSQTIFQNRTINSEFPLLNNHEYKGEVTVPVFPTAFAVYKIDNWAFSLGFGPNGGGGTAKYKTGLPSFEKQMASIPASLSAGNIPTEDYSANIQFDGSSVFWGTQLNGTYSFNDIFSLSLGVRMINAVNDYTGYLKNIMVNPNKPAYGFDGTMRTATSVFTTLSQISSATATSMNPIIAGGGGGYTLAQLQAAGQLTAEQVAALSGGLGADYSASMTASQVQSAYSSKSLVLAATATATADKEVDTRQTGTGFTPIIGINIHLDKLNVGIKYEHQTILKLTNATVVDGTGLFKDGEKSRNDIPAFLAAGADYKILDNMKISGSLNMYFDKSKSMNWGGNVYGQERTIDKNFIELSLGAEYWLTKNFALSAGYMNSNTGVSEQYQSDFSFSNDSYTTGLGFQWNVNKTLVLDAGMMLTTYKDDVKSFSGPAPIGTYKETYGKDTFTFGIGLGYKIF